MRNAVYETSIEAFGKKERKSNDWFEAKIQELEPAIEAKRATLLEEKRNPTKKTKAAHKAACSNAQRIARKCANDYWTDLCSSIQSAADFGNVRGMYEGMKKAFGPSIIKTAPLKSKAGETITDQAEQMERWAEHYQELYSRENIVTDKATEGTEALPMMDELDAYPTIEELEKALDSLASGKAPGKDGIPPEVLKTSKEKFPTPITSTISYYCAGKKAAYHKTCATQKSSPFTKTKENAVTVTTTVVSRC